MEYLWKAVVLYSAVWPKLESSWFCVTESGLFGFHCTNILYSIYYDLTSTWVTLSQVSVHLKGNKELKNNPQCRNCANAFNGTKHVKFILFDPHVTLMQFCWPQYIFNALWSVLGENQADSIFFKSYQLLSLMLFLFILFALSDYAWKFLNVGGFFFFFTTAFDSHIV